MQIRAGHIRGYGDNMKKIWIRLGGIIEITNTEEQMIFGDKGEQMEDTLRAVIADGRFCPDGETYIPSESVREFNRNYGTTHDEENWCCDL